MFPPFTNGKDKLEVFAHYWEWSYFGFPKGLGIVYNVLIVLIVLILVVLTPCTPNHICAIISQSFLSESKI